MNDGEVQTYTDYGHTFVVNTNDKVTAWVTKAGNYQQSPNAEKTYLPGNDTPGNGNSGIYGDIVFLDDREDHSWSFYSDADQPIHRLNPADVKITYFGNGTGNMTNASENGNAPTTFSADATGVKVGIASGETQNTFVYYKTLERADAEGTGNLPYTLIPNPFQVRPTFGSSTSRWRGFYGWRVKRLEGVGIEGYAVGSIIPAETEIRFVTTSEYGNEVDFEAIWAQAYVASNGTSGLVSAVGRERNFVKITSSGTSVSYSVPCTVTAYNPDGTDGNDGLYINGNITCGADMKIENIKVRNINSGYSLNADGHNLTIGRGVTQYSSNGCATNVYGRNANSSASLNFVLRIESGTFKNLYLMGSEKTYSGNGKTFTSKCVLGCDYDRASKNDGNLAIATGEGNVYGGEKLVFSSASNKDNLTFDWVVKSGKVHDGILGTGSGGDESIYLGSSQRTSAALQYVGKRRITLEGGSLAGIAGGMNSSTANGGSNYNNTTHVDQAATDNVVVRMKGGTVRGVIYGAATFAGAAGGRTYIITGGEVNGWIAGGCNGTQTTNGELYGSTYIYFGGNARCDSHGGEGSINSSKGGNIFGAGSGIEGGTTVGQVRSSTVVIADNAFVERNVYGGGNYGYVSEGDNHKSDVYILGNCQIGQEDAVGHVFGGSNQQMGQNVNIYMRGGRIYGNLFGGSNVIGSINGDINMEMTDGTVGFLVEADNSVKGGNVFGGGWGEETDVYGDVRVTISGGTALGSIYGGGEMGSVKGNGGEGGSATVNIMGDATVGHRSVDDSPYTGNVYGGGKGKAGADYSDKTVVSNAFVNVSGGHVYGSVFGGGENGHVSGDATVTIDGGQIGDSKTECRNSYHGNVYGGGRGIDEDSGSSSGFSATAGKVSGNTTVNIGEGARIMRNVYGGGNMASVGSTSGSANGWDLPVANTGLATVNINGGQIGEDGLADTIWNGNTIARILENGHVFGSSLGRAGEAYKDLARVNNSQIFISGSADIRGSVFGGGEDGHVLDSTYIRISGGTIGAVLTEAETSSDKNGSGPLVFRGNVYGGGRGLDTIPDPEHPGQYMYSTTAGFVRKNTRIEMTDGYVRHNVYGGGSMASVGIDEDASSGMATVLISGGQVGATGHNNGRVFGSGRGVANMNFSHLAFVNDTKVEISGTARVFSSVFGGGENGHVLNKTLVNVKGGAIGRDHDNSTFEGNVYGGGRGVDRNGAYVSGISRTAGKVYVETEVNITGGLVYRNVYGGGSMSSVGQIETETGLPTGAPYYYEDDDATMTDEDSGHLKLKTGIEHNGHTVINISGGTIGTDGDENGHVFGGSRGMAGPHYKHLSYTGETHITVSGGVINGSVFGGGEDGHVLANTNVVLNSGKIGRDMTGEENGVNEFGAPLKVIFFGNVYGGGRGLDTYEDPGHPGTFVHSPTAGWVKHHTNVTLNGGTVVHNVYGGGSLASVGLSENDDADYSGRATVVINGGQVGTDGMNNGRVFGSGRGTAGEAASEYTHLTYVKNTEVRMNGGHVLASVFGGGENGHVRQNTNIVVEGGLVGNEAFANDEHVVWAGNVFGGGRGIDEYGDSHHISSTAGWVQHNTNVTIDGGRVLRSVYGGGNMASVGISGSLDPDFSGKATVTVKNGVIGVDGDNQESGHVFGSGYGRPASVAGGDHYSDLTFVKNTYVTVEGGEVKGSVFGSGENGHVRQNSHVSIKGGVIGRNGTTGYEGNVFGGGRGRDKDDSGHYSRTSGRVFGNSFVDVYDGHIKGSVYGGGHMASVGTYPAEGTYTADVDYSNGGETGRATVLVMGGEIGVEGSTELRGGNVYGSGKGLAGSSYDHLAYLKNSEIIVRGGHIYGSVFGSGEDGHVYENTKVVVNDGIIGFENGNEYKGNVYGGGRGIDQYEDPIGSGIMHFSPTAGIVRGHTRVYIKGGTVWGNVYGGGNESIVSLEKVVNINGGTVKKNVFGGCNQVPVDEAANHPGIKTVNVRAGKVEGNVYGCSNLSIDGNFAEGHEKDWTAFVNVSGGEIGGNVYGMGYAGEVKGSTLVSIGANAIAAKKGGGYTEVRNADNLYFDDCTYLPTVLTTTVHHESDQDYCVHAYVSGIGNSTVTERGVYYGTSAVPDIKMVDPTSTPYEEEGNGQYSVKLNGLTEGQTYFVRAYAINGDGTAYGDEICFVAKEGLPEVVTEYINDISGGTAKVSGQVNGDYTERGICYGTSEYPTKEGTHVAAGSGDALFTVDLSGLTEGTIYYVRAYAVNGDGVANYGKQMTFVAGTAHSDHEVYYDRVEHAHAPIVEDKLAIGGSVFAGSDYYGTSGVNINNWFHFDATGYSNIVIDGDGYNTTSDEASAAHYMNIGGGLFGSSSHCESGESGRNIIVRKYGTRNTTTGDQLTSATRTLTTIQRCGNLLLDESNVNLLGADDLNGISSNTSKYAIIKVDDTLYVSNASSLVLGYGDMTSQIDSVKAVRSVYLNVTGTNTLYEALANLDPQKRQCLGLLPWDWVGIKDDDNHLYRIRNNAVQGSALTAAQENVILFGKFSKMWVRYAHWNAATQGNERYYGELNGFFRMESPYSPYGMESFAYARVKIDGSNMADGGFLSYDNDNNFFTDSYEPFTKTKQYPYTNVLQISKKDGLQYREWCIPELKGHRWYVDGTRDWGRDRTKTDGWGLAPDKPKKTIFGAVGSDDDHKGGIVSEVSGDNNLNFQYKNDIIYLVGGLSPDDEAAIVHDSILEGVYNSDYPLKLYRYPGGHALSWATTNEAKFHNDIGGGTVPEGGNMGVLQSWEGNLKYQGPGAYYGPVLTAPSKDQKAFTFEGVEVDGLYGHSGIEDGYLLIPGPGENGWHPKKPDGSEFDEWPEGVTIETFAFDQSQINAPLIVTQKDSEITLRGGTVLKRNCNNAEASYYNDPFYKGAGIHGGAVFVHDGASLNLEGKVTVIDNKQKLGADVIESNVYLPTFAKSVNLVGALNAASLVGITSPIGNDADTYMENTLSPVAEAVTHDIAQTAWDQNNFLDDLGRFFGRGYASLKKNTYFDKDDESDKVLRFGWTWNNIVTADPGLDSYAEEGDLITVKDEKGLAWLISMVNGLNGNGATPMAGKTVKLAADLDMRKYVWLPIGALATPFEGRFDGQGHLIENLDIAFIGMGDGRYNRANYGLFGVVAGGSVERTFVLSGHLEPVADLGQEGQANIGGIVGQLSGAYGSVANSESAVDIVCADRKDRFNVGGMVGRLIEGEVHSSIGMPHIVATGTYATGGYIGGLVGRAESDGGEKALHVNNSYANPRYTLAAGDIPVSVGGLVGYNAAIIQNCYTRLQAGSTNLNKFNLLAFETKSSVKNSHGFKPYGETAPFNVEYRLAGFDAGFDESLITDCHYYAPAGSADAMGYLYDDNKLYGKSGDEWVLQDTSMFVSFNRYLEKADGLNDAAAKKYARWARPTIAELNDDLPVLLMCNYNDDKAGVGPFRSMGTYKGTQVLQYGGTVRDPDGDHLNEMLRHINSGGAGYDYLYVYGDVKETVSGTLPQKVAIHEDAAILAPGVLANLKDTYVGVSFVNSSAKLGVTATDFYGDKLYRDWHMFATPLKEASLGVNYTDDNQHAFQTYVDPPYPFFAAEETRDGYFPSIGTSLANKPDDVCDFFCWYEPDWQWINFKRNGKSHWHFDTNPDNQQHEHIDYHYDNNTANDASKNLNEPNLVQGKGYMMAIKDDTYMQSHGQLNDGNVTIKVTAQANAYGVQYKGHNLVGNPYHAYLDFDKFNGEYSDFKSFYIYDADENGYVTYPVGGSKGGRYAPRYIHPHQGFFIKTEATKDITFRPEMCVMRNEGGSAYRDESPAYPLVNLYAEDAEGRRDILVVEFERPENGGGFKAKALMNGNHQVYAHLGDDDFGAFFAKKGTEKVAVRFRSLESEATTYTLRWDTQNGDFQSLRLIDNLLGVDYDMLENDSYVFSASKNDYLSRFQIVFDVTGIEEQPAEAQPSGFAFFDGSQWVVSGKGYLDLIDMTGRVLQTQRLSGAQSSVNFNRFADGVYLLRLRDKETVRIQKIIIK